MTREIPCRIGDEVFAIQNFKGTKHIMKGKVSEMFFVGEEMDLCIVVYHIIRGYWGKDIFDTYEKAEEYLMLIGEALKRARESKGLTQKQLAEMLYVDPTLICRWEKGQREIPLVTLVQIEEILETMLTK